MSFLAAIIALVAFILGLVLGWDGITISATRCLFIGLAALSAAVVLPDSWAFPVKRP